MIETYKEKIDKKEGVFVFDEEKSTLVYKEYIILLGVNKNAAEQWTRFNEREESEYFTTVEIPASLFFKYDEIRKRENTVVTYKLDEGFKVFDADGNLVEYKQGC